MTSLRVIAVPALSDNYIWLLADAGGRTVVVDPGEAAPVLSALESQTLLPAAILLTHHHPDHIGGVAGITARYGDLPVIAPHDDRIGASTRRVADGERLALQAPQVEFDVIAIPGHTLTHVAYAGAGIVFAGDTMFSVGCGRLFEGTPAQMLDSLGRLATLAPDTLLCCGHEYTVANCAFALSVDPGNADLRARDAAARAARARGEPTLPVRLGEELKTNPFLRSDTPALRAAYARAHGGRDAEDRIERFAWLRAAKDGFRAPA